MQLVQAGIRSSTKKTYSSVQRQYLQFCQYYNLCPVPATEVTILLYVTHVNKKGLAHGSVMVHLAAIRNLHVQQGYGEPNVACPQIKQALKAIKDAGPQPIRKQPIKLQLLMEMWKLLQGTSHELLWKAVLSIAFYGGLRVAEYTATQAKSNTAPSVNSIRFEKSKGQIIMYYTVAQTKTCPAGITVPYGCSRHQVCAVCAVKAYLNYRSAPGTVYSAEPLFSYNGKPVTRTDVEAVIKSLISQVGLPPEEYSAHSLRAGVASTAAEAGFRDWEVQNLGGGSPKYTTVI